nr:midasin [Ipomoea trifida]
MVIEMEEDFAADTYNVSKDYVDDGDGNEENEQVESAVGKLTCPGDYMLKFYSSETLVKDYKGCDFPRNMFRLHPFECLKTVDANVLFDAAV